MTIGHEGDQPELSGVSRTFRVKRLSLVEINDLIVYQEGLLVSDPDSFAFKLSLNVSQMNWEKRFGAKRIPLSYKGVRPEDVEKLLGSTGVPILRKISGIINLAAIEWEWSLEALEVRWPNEPEIENIGNVLVVTRVPSSQFGRADYIMKSLRHEVEAFSSLSEGDRLILDKGIRFSIEPVALPKPNENFGKNPQEQR